MTRLFVLNGNNTVVIDTAFGRGPEKNMPLEIVADVVAAFFPLKTPEELSLCFLHLSQGVAPPALCRLSGNGAIRSSVDLQCLIAAGIAMDDDSALIVKEENPLGGAGSTVVETIKLLTFSGPVDPARNLLIPFDQIPWANKLFQHVDAQDSTPEELSLCFLHLSQGVAPPALCRLSGNGAIRSSVDLQCLIAAGIAMDDDSALIVKEENPLGGAGSTVVETIKLLTFSGPVDPARNLLIPFDQIPWANKLFQHVDAQDSVLLHGHRQSGKTSALLSLKRRAEGVGTTVYYLDIKALFPNLSQCASVFAFLASELSPSFSHQS
ncbi:hypothetical protein BDR26DRAFT_930940 [Obelidium mucronatum]|nr:hypothetical protein BDR26DRAFT_930940 [Obelidium mucronatum]